MSPIEFSDTTPFDARICRAIKELILYSRSALGYNRRTPGIHTFGLPTTLLTCWRVK
jgi:hypothetical protein